MKFVIALLIANVSAINLTQMHSTSLKQDGLPAELGAAAAKGAPAAAAKGVEAAVVSPKAEAAAKAALPVDEQNPPEARGAEADARIKEAKAKKMGADHVKDM